MRLKNDDVFRHPSFMEQRLDVRQQRLETRARGAEKFREARGL